MAVTMKRDEYWRPSSSVSSQLLPELW